MHPMLNIAIQAARQAGKTIMRYMDQLDLLQVDEKSHNSLVSDIDKMAEAEIIQHLRKAYPNHAILAEESGEIPADSEYCWIIDPLDGSTNYLHSFPHYAVSIAMQYRGKLELACIYDPMRQELYTANKGKGAYLNAKRIRVSSPHSLQQALIGTGFPHRDPEQLETYLKQFKAIFPKTADVRRAGSAALDLAFVAAGRLDGFWESNLQPWDMAAGILLVQEAGGFVTDFNGQENSLNNGQIVAGNPKIHKLLVENV